MLAAGTLFKVDDTPKDQKALTSRTYTKSELGISSDTESNPDDEENYIPDEEFETDPFGEVEESRPQPLLRELTARLMPTRPTVSDITPAHSNESVATVPLDGAQVDPSTSTSSPPAIMVADPHIFELPSPDELAHQLEELEIEEGKTAEQDDGFVVQKSRKHKKNKKQDAPQGLLTGICSFVSPAKYTHEPSLSSGEQQGSHQGSQQSSHPSSNLSTSQSDQRSNPYEVLSDDQDFQEAESD